MITWITESIKMGIFHSDNNLGLEVFFIGVLLMCIFVTIYFFWVVLSDWKYRKKKREEENDKLDN